MSQHFPKLLLNSDRCKVQCKALKSLVRRSVGEISGVFYVKIDELVKHKVQSVLAAQIYGEWCPMQVIP